VSLPADTVACFRYLALHEFYDDPLPIAENQMAMGR
jgi:hypothetical protein